MILHWPDAPFRDRDRIAQLIGGGLARADLGSGRLEPPGFLTRIDGAPFHYLELDQPHAAALDGRDADAPARLARAMLVAQFGTRAIANARVAAATAWRHDPWSRASWAVIPPGRAPARQALKAPAGNRVWFAGEALSREQWGTAGGAWEEGTRAADEIAAALGESPGRA